MRKFPYLLLLLFFSFTIVLGCKEEKKVDIFRSLDSTKMPTMSTRNISTLISDSGITQYKIIAPLWNIYDEATVPFWSFPEGLYLQKFDPDYNVIATVGADSAWYYKNERLWKLMGKVEMTKVPDELFLSPRLYWDQRKQQIYSDTFIHIENSTHVIEGTGFESDESLNKYRILFPTGIFPIDKEAQRAQTPSSTNSGSPINTPVQTSQTQIIQKSPPENSKSNEEIKIPSPSINPTEIQTHRSKQFNTGSPQLQ